MIKEVAAFTIPKELVCPTDNEDAYLFDADKQVFALCDGASESFDSKNWANILTQNFIHNPEISDTWLMECVQKYLKCLNLVSLTNSQLIAFQKGSFATFIGISYKNNELKITCIGDSCVFLFSGYEKNDFVEFKSYLELFEKPNFSDNPILLSTRIISNDFVNFAKLSESKFYKSYSLASQYESLKGKETPTQFVNDTYLICATDAIAEWIFKYIEAGKEKKIFQYIMSLRNPGNENKFAKTVVLCRRLKSMRVDDSTLVVLKCEHDHDLS